MALTLPYPDMVFVPLDILTAEEQNQLVGNIEFLANQFPLSASNIANGAIGSDQLAAGAVTNEKIGTSAVQSDNVDSATFGSPWLDTICKLNIATTTVKVTSTVTVNLLRVGNLVVYQFDADNANIGDSGSSTTPIPVGYRPTRTVGVPMRNSSGTAGLWRINSNGSANWYTAAGQGGVATAFAVYNTTNDWPS